MTQYFSSFGFPLMKQPYSGPVVSPGLLTAQAQIFPSLYLYRFSLCDLLFYQDDGGRRFLQNNGTHLPYYTSHKTIILKPGALQEIE
jgi:hypothetical protein